MKTQIKASMTVEASILLPFIIIVSIVIMYLGIYVYDRTMMVADVNTISNAITDADLYDSGIRGVMENEFNTIKEEHPYLSVENMELMIDDSGTGCVVGLSGDWILPILPGYNRKLEYKKEVRFSSPIAVMYAVRGVESLLKENEDEDSDDI